MGTPMNAVSLRELIACVEEAERRVWRASGEVEVLRREVHEAQARYQCASTRGDENHGLCHSIQLRISTLQGVMVMFQQYTQVKERQLDWLQFFFKQRTGIRWDEYKQTMRETAQKFPHEATAAAQYHAAEKQSPHVPSHNWNFERTSKDNQEAIPKQTEQPKPTHNLLSDLEPAHLPEQGYDLPDLDQSNSTQNTVVASDIFVKVPISFTKIGDDHLSIQTSHCEHHFPEFNCPKNDFDICDHFHIGREKVRSESDSDSSGVDVGSVSSEKDSGQDVSSSDERAWDTHPSHTEFTSPTEETWDKYADEPDCDSDSSLSDPFDLYDPSSPEVHCADNPHSSVPSLNNLGLSVTSAGDHDSGDEGAWESDSSLSDSFDHYDPWMDPDMSCDSSYLSDSCSDSDAGAEIFV